MVEQSDPSHLYIYASCVCVRARKGCGTAGMQADWPTLQAHSQASQLAGTWAQGGRHAQDPPGALTTAARYSNITHTCGDYLFSKTDMDKKIYLPNDEQSSQLIENAWQDFSKQAEEAGFPLPDLLKDVFVAGYSFGHNDCLSIISGQLKAMEVVKSLNEK